MKAMSAAAAGFAAATIILSGCGLDSATTPDTAPPQAPAISQAYAKGNGKAVVTWSPNTEVDLAGYNVYHVGPTSKVNAAPIQTPYFVDENLPEGAVFYRVTAVDRSGNESAPSAIVRVSPGGPSLSDVNGESGKKN